MIRTYFIITIGCQMNKADSERIAGYLEAHGLKEAKAMQKADLVFLTTCGVRQTAEDRIYGLCPKIKRENQKCTLILTGCLANRNDVQRRVAPYVDVFMPISELDKCLPPLVKGGWGDLSPLMQKVLQMKQGKNPPYPPLLREAATIPNHKSQITNHCSYLNIPPKYGSKFSAFVPIGNGCDNFCSYCVVPYARGREAYRDAEEIIEEVKRLVDNGYKEITLIAQNVNSYMSKLKVKSAKLKVEKQTKKFIDFADLLKMVNDISGDFWIRFATSHPKDMGEKLIDTIAECEKVCKHIHLPVQAGDNEILKKMNRRYTIGHYKKLIEKIRKKLPDAALTTDIIVGFPGETRKQFQNTAMLFKEIKFDLAYISQYSPRPQTAASKLEDNVSKAEKKKREEDLMVILRKTALANNKKYIGKTVRVLVDWQNKRREYFGKTDTYKVVKFKSDKKDLVGKFVEVEIIKADDFGLEGRI